MEVANAAAQELMTLVIIAYYGLRFLSRKVFGDKRYQQAIAGD